MFWLLLFVGVLVVVGVVLHIKHNAMMMDLEAKVDDLWHSIESHFEKHNTMHNTMNKDCKKDDCCKK